jgi:hypothetical protein
MLSGLLLTESLRVGAELVADELAEALSRVLRPEDGWYTDFAVGDDHVVVFAERVFRYRQGDEAGLAEAVAHGRSVGTPEHQLDWES